MTIRDVMTAHLKALKWTRANLAGDLGITKDTISRWRDNPPQYVMAYLAKAEAKADCEDRVKELERALDVATGDRGQVVQEMVLERIEAMRAELATMERKWKA